MHISIRQHHFVVVVVVGTNKMTFVVVVVVMVMLTMLVTKMQWRVGCCCNQLWCRCLSWRLIFIANLIRLLIWFCNITFLFKCKSLFICSKCSFLHSTAFHMHMSKNIHICMAGIIGLRKNIERIGRKMVMKELKLYLVTKKARMVWYSQKMKGY